MDRNKATKERQKKIDPWNKSIRHSFFPFLCLPKKNAWSQVGSRFAQLCTVIGLKDLQYFLLHHVPAFSYPEAMLLLVSTKNHDLWECPTPEVHDSHTSCHSVHAQSQSLTNLIGWDYETNSMHMLKKSDLTKDRNSWYWPKGAQPLGMRMHLRAKPNRSNGIVFSSQGYRSLVWVFITGSFRLCCSNLPWLATVITVVFQALQLHLMENFCQTDSGALHLSWTRHTLGDLTQGLIP